MAEREGGARSVPASIAGELFPDPLLPLDSTLPSCDLTRTGEVYCISFLCP